MAIQKYTYAKIKATHVGFYTKNVIYACRKEDTIFQSQRSKSLSEKMSSSTNIK